MVTKITVRRVGGFLSKPTEVLLLVGAFLSLNFYLLSTVEQRFVREITSLNKSGGEPKSILKKATDIQDQVITLEEDGRFGNLLLETATLLLIGKKLNKRVQLLPQVGKKLKNYFSSLPAETIDYTKHCVCHYCTDCLCPRCNKWTKVPSWTYFSNPEKFNSTYLMLKWFNSEMVLRNLQDAKEFFRDLLREDIVGVIQDYLRVIGSKWKTSTFVNIHVRRTDYINFVETRYQGHGVDHRFFLYCIDQFLKEDPNSVFIVTSDDIAWCKENIKHDRVIFPNIISSADPTVTDFVIMTQTNHTIYDYGSFAFWGAVLSGGKTMVAEGYSPKLHPILRAVKKYPPPGWTTVDVRKL